MQGKVDVVRIKIAAEQPASETDPREFIGYRDGLSTEDLWERGRAAWRLRAEKVLACDYLVIAHGGIIRMVGTIDGVHKFEGRGDRLAITGTPLPDNRLIGTPDPLDNKSQNPISYGTIEMEHFLA